MASYRENFAEAQQGKVGITLSVGWKEPQQPSNSSHLAASETAMMFELGWYTEPVLGTGRYPAVMRERVDAKSAAQGFPESRLPVFTQEEAALNLGSVDFLGINMYTSSLVFPQEEGIDQVRQRI